MERASAYDLACQEGKKVGGSLTHLECCQQRRKS